MYKKHIGYAVKSLSRNIDKIMSTSKTIRENENLSAMQRWILNFLFKNENRDVFQKDVESEFRIRRSTATEALKSMEKANLIYRVPVDYDARLKKIVLTDFALKIKSQIDEELQKVEAALVAGVPKEDIELFFALIEQFKKNIKDFKF